MVKMKYKSLNTNVKKVFLLQYRVNSYKKFHLFVTAHRDVPTTDSEDISEKICTV